MGQILCLKCRKPLDAEGEVICEGRRLTVYSCDSCTVPWDFDGQCFEVALTFAIDEDGNAFDPATGQALPPPSGRSAN